MSILSPSVSKVLFLALYSCLVDVNSLFPKRVINTMASFASDFLVMLLVGVVKPLPVCVCQPHPKVFAESQSHVSTLLPGQFGSRVSQLFDDVRQVRNTLIVVFGNDTSWINEAD